MLTNYLNIDQFRDGRFYLFPKIHEKGVPGRPICSSVNRPVSTKSKSYLGDTQHINKHFNKLSKLKSLLQIPEGAILCTLDVSSLCTNIPNQEGILAVAEKLRGDPSKTPIAKFTIDLLKLVLHNMNFEYNGEQFLQT